MGSPEEVNDLEKHGEYLMVKMFPEERNLRCSGRRFGCSVPEGRMHTVLQDNSVAALLSTTEELESMMQDERDLESRYNSFRQVMSAYPDHRVIYITRDVSGRDNGVRGYLLGPFMSSELNKMLSG